MRARRNRPSLPRLFLLLPAARAGGESSRKTKGAKCMIAKLAPVGAPAASKKITGGPIFYVISHNGRVILGNV
jgi:ribosomal protein L35AE/L33A